MDPWLGCQRTLWVSACWRDTTRHACNAVVTAQIGRFTPFGALEVVCFVIEFCLTTVPAAPERLLPLCFVIEFCLTSLQQLLARAAGLLLLLLPLKQLPHALQSALKVPQLQLTCDGLHRVAVEAPQTQRRQRV